MDSFAFILHPLDPKADVARKYPNLARLLPVRAIHFLSLYWPPLVLSHIRSIRSAATGREVEGWLLACPLTARRMLEVPPRVAYRKIIQTGRLAERLGARILGLGAYTSVVGDGGLTVARALQIPVTTGDSYTAALSVQALLEAAGQVGMMPERATVAVVGATGAIGGACARLLAPRAGRLLLVGRRADALEAMRAELSAGASGPVEAATDETITLALEGRFEDYTVGKELDVSRVREIQEMAARHGFRLAPLHCLDRPLPPERIRAVAVYRQQTV
jgi:fatty aldehyde-generating acyl-ACP reductase